MFVEINGSCERSAEAMEAALAPSVQNNDACVTKQNIHVNVIALKAEFASNIRTTCAFKNMFAIALAPRLQSRASSKVLYPSGRDSTLAGADQYLPETLTPGITKKKRIYLYLSRSFFNASRQYYTSC